MIKLAFLMVKCFSISNGSELRGKTQKTTEVAGELTKAELVVEVAKSAGVTKAKAISAVDAFFQAIQATLAKGEKVQVVGFGTFEPHQRAARKGRNPQKPEEMIDIPAKTVPVFRAGKALRELVNQPKKKKK